MLQDKKKRVFPATDWVKILDDVELVDQSKHPHAVRKQPVLFDESIVPIYSRFVFLIPLVSGLVSFPGMQVGQPAAQRFQQNLRQVEPGGRGRFYCLSIKLDLNALGFAHSEMLLVTPCRRR